MHKPSYKRLSKVVMCCLGFVGCGAALALEAGTSAQLVHRNVPDKASYGRLPPTTPIERIVIKFHEGTHVRMNGGVLSADLDSRSVRELGALHGLGISDKQLLADVTQVNALFHPPQSQAIQLFRAPIGQVNDVASRTLRPTFSDREEILASLRQSGEARSGRELADLNLYYDYPVVAGTTYADVADRVRALNALGSVEIAYAQPPIEPAQTDIPPTSSNYENEQGFLDDAPTGIGARYAWTIPGGNGAGVRIIDLENAYNPNHEDMPPLFTTYGVPPDQIAGRNHGTAVLGVMGAAKNEYGVTGIAWGASIGIQALSISNGVLRAASDVGPGGVLVIAQQGAGPSGQTCSCNQSACGAVPVEYWQAAYDAIANATANGVIVVEAAGNGNAALDNARYGGLFDRAVRDSGAVIVAASDLPGYGDGSYGAPTCFTSHGSRIDAYAWGYGVVTMGYGYTSDPNQWYSDIFGGTSAAAPIVAGAIASLQGVVLARQEQPLDAWQMRNLISRTGTAQLNRPVLGSGEYKTIGKMPDLLAATNEIAKGVK